LFSTSVDDIIFKVQQATSTVYISGDQANLRCVFYGIIHYNHLLIVFILGPSDRGSDWPISTWQGPTCLSKLSFSYKAFFH